VIVQEERGNLLTVFQSRYLSAIAHGCNCVWHMGGGIAKAIVEAWPEVALVDELHASAADNPLGGYSVVPVPEGIVVNLYTQIGPGRVPVGLERNIQRALRRFSGAWEKSGALRRYISADRPLGVPRIGCGLAGGSWDTIGPVVHEASGAMPVVVIDGTTPFFKKWS
jgi:O-acetyl-ADP-ribose deacetylase (regulator of RNase III)